ncbi:hypothetical protein AB0I53_48205 [Saccharopolyspora sp. NPDC050389]
MSAVVGDERLIELVSEKAGKNRIQHSRAVPARVAGRVADGVSVA